MTDRASAEVPAAQDPVREQHRQIGLLALARGYLTTERLVRAMLLVGEQPREDVEAFWVGGGYLDATEYAELLHVLGTLGHRDSGSNPGAGLSTASAAMPSPSNDGADDPQRSFTLADVVKTHAYDVDDARGPGDEAAESEERLLGESGLGSGRPIASRSGLSTTRERYIVGNELGRGAVGRVIKAFDRDLGRTVAMKVPLRVDLSAHARERFIEEAQATGQLEHPNIVPVYDIGSLSTGELYYSMKRVRSHSLRDVLRGLQRGDPAIVAEYGETRLLSIFLQVCQAIHYAHSRGVIHRDIKPDNIMLGEYGEVHVMDWGLARIIHGGVVTERSLRRPDRAEAGQTVGTPAYMPPEQAQGLIDQVNERSDIYSLGVILYEIVTLRQPSTRPTVMETLMAVITEPILPPRKVAPDRNISEDMECIILRALEKDPAKRYASARELHDALERFLDGRRDHEADNRFREGAEQAELYHRSRETLQYLDSEVRSLQARIHSWDDVATKRTLWQLEEERHAVAVRMIRAFAEARRELTEALAWSPDHVRARERLSHLFWTRYELAEQSEDVLEQIYYENLVAQYDDGTYLHRIHGTTPVSIRTEPAGAHVFLLACQEHDRRLRLGDPTFLGATPIEAHALARGRYHLLVKHPERGLVELPLMIRRPDPVEITVDLPAEVGSRSAAGFVFVPGGATIVGGDPAAFDPLPMQVMPVASFWIQREPVTVGEYLAFLNAMHASDPAAAARHVPRTRADAGHLAILRDGVYVANPILIEGPARAMYPEGAGWENRLPALAVTLPDALAYAAWRSGVDGVLYRLPDEIEWERAARGADGRRFPWGNHFDATFCKMAASRAIPSQPEPVGTFLSDRSPFGVQDLAGGQREWVTPVAGLGVGALCKGGHWIGDERFCRAATRWRVDGNIHSATIGFRLAFSSR